MSGVAAMRWSSSGTPISVPPRSVNKCGLQQPGQRKVHPCVEMGGYEDYLMAPPNGDAVAGICNSRGANVGMPNAWLPYFTVADIEASARQVEVLGGRLRSPIRSMGDMGRYCVIEDVGGAVC